MKTQQLLNGVESVGNMGQLFQGLGSLGSCPAWNFSAFCAVLNNVILSFLEVTATYFGVTQVHHSRWHGFNHGWLNRQRCDEVQLQVGL